MYVIICWPHWVSRAKGRIVAIRLQLSDLLVHEVEYLVRTRGYALVEGYLDESECQVLKCAYEPLLLAYKAGGNARSHQDQHHIHDLLAQDLLFGTLLEDQGLQQLLAPLLGPSWIMYAFTSSSVPPRGENFGHRVHVDSPRLIPGHPTNIGIIWALDEFTSANGATEVLPGSNHQFERPSDELFAKHCARVCCAAGSLVVFDARVYHRAGVNQTDRWRHSLTMNCCRPYMKQRMDWVRLIPEGIARKLNAQARRLIGFDTRLPTSLDEFFVPDEQRLYRAGQE